MDTLNNTFIFGYSLMQILKFTAAILVIVFLFYLAKDFFSSGTTVQVTTSRDLSPISPFEKIQDSFSRGYQNIKANFK
jgi:flagellar biosynthesis protein FlhB